MAKSAGTDVAVIPPMIGAHSSLEDSIRLLDRAIERSRDQGLPANQIGDLVDARDLQVAVRDEWEIEMKRWKP